MPTLSLSPRYTDDSIALWRAATAIGAAVIAGVKTDLKRIHGTDERVGVSDMGLEVRAYRRIVLDGAQLRAR